MVHSFQRFVQHPQFKKQFLPVGLILAIAFALLVPRPGQVIKDVGSIPYLIMVIFGINGYQVSFSLTAFNRRLFSSFACLILTSLILAPFLAMVISSLLSLSSSLALGLIVMSAMPTTLSSGIVITQSAGGSNLWALLFTMGLNFVGIITIPLMLSQCLSASAQVDIDVIKLFFKLLTLVFIPFAIGHGLKRVLPTLPYQAVINYIPSVCVILTVLASMSSSRHQLLGSSFATLALMVMCSILIHVTLLVLHGFLGKWLKLQTPERKAFVFIGSQKTLPIAISVLASLQTEVGLALLVCIVFHFLQLLMDAKLASHWVGRDEGQLW